MGWRIVVIVHTLLKPSRSTTPTWYAITTALLASASLLAPSVARAQSAPVQPPAARAASPIYKNPTAPLEARVNDLFTLLTQDEKLNLLSVDNHIDAAMLDGPGVPRLDVRPLRTTDAPQGLRVSESTYYPVGVIMASTWDPALINQVGSALGEEARALGRQVVYGPSINVQRTPQGGRFFENFSEDPYVISTIASAYIQGMQSQGVAACPKHFFGNDQEEGRHIASSDMDERTMQEIYLRPFHVALTKAHAWSVMVAFNKVNGTFVVESKPFLIDMLRTQWNWNGLAIGDWGSLHDTATSLNAGIDLEMPQPSIYSPSAVTDALTAGTITQTTVDASVRNILRLMIRTGLADDPPPSVPTDVDGADHQALALKVAEEGITLLKNDRNILPLDRTKIKSIAVIGPNAQDTQLGGRWSADTPFFYQTDVLDGIRKIVGTGVDVEFAEGCRRFKKTPDAMIADAAALAGRCDVAVVVVGTDKSYLGEEKDVDSLYLPGDQDSLIQAVEAANKNTVVVLNNGMPLLMDKWLPQTPGLVEAWYAGQEQGNAIANILFGNVNPSGKLPATIATRREDYSDWPNYPGTDDHISYAEGVYVGYRHFDKSKIEPQFPFGFGLSYTTFSYTAITAPKSMSMDAVATASVQVRNTGQRAGDEIVELYVRPLHPLVDRPLRELKGYQRVSLQPGKDAIVSIPIDVSAFSYWDVVHHQWQADPGDYAIDIGSSSRDIQLTAKIHLTGSG